MIIVPSLLNANTFEIAKQLNEIKKVGITRLHIDVMDGHFVPNQAFGPNTINDLKEKTDFVLDVHLMIEHPEYYLENYRNADIITVHFESTNHLYRVIQQIHSFGKKAGVAINPATPVQSIYEVLPIVDQVLVMTINPGVSNQTFIPHTIKKMKELHQIKTENKLKFEIQVDGNITNKTILNCLEAGVDAFVSGGYIFKDNITKQIQNLYLAGEAYDY